jgi:DNA-binding response OmpR family regulator
MGDFWVIVGTVYAYRIRRKLHDERGEFLQSDPSVGYRLVPSAMR